MAEEQDFVEVRENLSHAKDAFVQAYNDLGVEMQHTGTASAGKIGAVKDALKALDEALPKETRKKIAELENPGATAG